MRLEYKRLSSGYHYVRDATAHHLFAQWPVGTPLKTEHISMWGELSPITLYAFMTLAESLASDSDQQRSPEPK